MERFILLIIFTIYIGSLFIFCKKDVETRKLLEHNSNTTSYSNNAIQNLQQLSKADKHNLRKYDDNNKAY